MRRVLLLYTVNSNGQIYGDEDNVVTFMGLFLRMKPSPWFKLLMTRSLSSYFLLLFPIHASWLTTLSIDSKHLSLHSCARNYTLCSSRTSRAEGRVRRRRAYIVCSRPNIQSAVLPNWKLSRVRSRSLCYQSNFCSCCTRTRDGLWWSISFALILLFSKNPSRVQNQNDNRNSCLCMLSTRPTQDRVWYFLIHI